VLTPLFQIKNAALSALQTPLTGRRNTGRMITNCFGKYALKGFNLITNFKQEYINLKSNELSYSAYFEIIQSLVCKPD
jgi:hypothetical protein